MINIINSIVNTIIILIVLLITIIYQSIIYHYIISFPRIHLWLSKNNRKEILDKSRKDIMDIGSMEGYFDSLPDNIIHEYVTPIFDKSILIKKEMTNQFDKTITSKEGSLPFFINMFTTPHTLLGTWVGDSIFRTDYSKRGKNNRYKEVYMEALGSEDLEEYRDVIIRYFNSTFTPHLEKNYFDFIQKINIDLTYLIHFGFLPNEEDYKGCYYFIEAVRTHILKLDDIKKQIDNLPSFHKRTLNYINSAENQKTIVGKWWSKKHLSPNNIFMEFIHNILGMAINWTNLTYKYMLNHTQGIVPDIPEHPELRKAYIYECFRFLLPTRFTSSNVKKPEIFNLPKDANTLAIHDLKIPCHSAKYFGSDPQHFILQRMENHQKDTVSLKSKCPFSGFFDSPKGAKIACGTELFEKEGYLPFGEGYRRCPGEHLSMIFLEELAEQVKRMKYTIKLKDGISKPDFYIWGEIDRNLIFSS